MLVKAACEHCSGHIEFDNEYVGEAVECPHCFETTKLFVLTESVPPIIEQSTVNSIPPIQRQPPPILKQETIQNYSPPVRKQRNSKKKLKEPVEVKHISTSDEKWTPFFGPRNAEIKLVSRVCWN